MEQDEKDLVFKKCMQSIKKANIKHIIDLLSDF